MEQLTGWMLLVLAFGTGVTLIALKFAERRHRRNIEFAVRLERIRAWNKAENDGWRGIDEQLMNENTALKQEVSELQSKLELARHTMKGAKVRDVRNS